MSNREEIEKKEEAMLRALTALREEIDSLGKTSFFMHWPNTIKNFNRQINSSLKNMMIIVDKMLTKEEKDHDG